MDRHLLACGALTAALSIIAGAFGAHALEGRLDVGQLEIWETASRYLMYAALGTVVMALTAERCSPKAVRLSGGTLLAGGVLFCATLFALALGAPRWFGALTPLGGLAMIAGWLIFAAAALRSRKSS